MALRTALTGRLGIRHPVLLAPMGGSAGGALAGAVSAAGGLGLIGGGHGSIRRATMTLVPAVADLVERSGDDALVVAAGGIADGRGLAAALMLGAAGVLIGTRFYASDECIGTAAAKARLAAASGDD